MKKLLYRLLILTGSSALMGNLAMAQGNAYNYMPLPARDSVYLNAGMPLDGSPGHSFGYWFIAPVDFTITGLEVDTQSGSYYSSQTFQVMKLHGPIVAYPDSSTYFENLYYDYTDHAYMDSVKIPVAAGDTIGLIGQVATLVSLSAYGTPFSTSIGSYPVQLHALFSDAGNLNDGPVSWYSTRGPGSRIGRIGLFYSLSPTGISGSADLAEPIRIYPNPARQLLRLSGLIEATAWSVTGLAGEMLLSGKISPSAPSIDIRSLAPGMYILNLFSDKGQQHLKFVKEP